MLYRANINTPMGDMVFAVDSNEIDAKRDIRCAVAAMFALYGNQITAKAEDIKMTNKRILAGMEPVNGCTSFGKNWAWVKRA